MNNFKEVNKTLLNKDNAVKNLVIKMMTGTNPIFFFLVGLFLGGLSVHMFSIKNSVNANKINQLRDSKQEYTRPLLLCDIDQEIVNPDYESLKLKLNGLIAGNIENGSIETMSIYFRDLYNASVVSINPQEKYVPASLNKVPLMMQILDKASKNPGYLETKFKYLNNEDANLVQMIKPEETLEYGKTYSVNDALEKMIIFSDNASYNELLKRLDYEEYLSIFEKLRIPIDNKEGITVYNYSHFLRVLYNTTYLGRTYSEAALSFMAKSRYTNALVAGVAKDVEVAHKFGLSGSVNEDGQVENRQLHDCGIFYLKDKTYLLCVMTKSNAQIETIENAIKEVSKLVYEEVSRVTLQDKFVN